MDFSVNVIKGIIFMLPGFVFSHTSMSEDKILQRSPLGSSSVIFLAVVPLISIMIHFLWASLFALNELVVRKTGISFPLGFEPNIYKWFLTEKSASDISSDVICYGFFIIMLISITPLMLTSFTGKIDPYVKFFRKFQRRKEPFDTQHEEERWLFSLIRRSRPDDRYLMAYVVTNDDSECGKIGYCGVVERVGQQTDGTISFVVISYVQPFTVSISSEGLQNKFIQQPYLPTQSFTRENISHVSFEIHVNTCAP
ncbi:MAG: hypothetical protein COA43_00805 [Robiginitomaculum sp.]|nr:MAG: hypothetical protein COA43_00805 [Robiginitomaculum sp.]